MPQPLIECIPNFSEGRDSAVILALEESIRSVEGVTLLHSDPGKAANRTVITFVGSPLAVVEAAFRSIREAAARIDMSRHHGAHPRLGATDVCPLVPIRDISMEETVRWAQQLARRVGEELQIPVYLYEFASKQPGRKSLADIRSGEYEGLESKLRDPRWHPDFGPAQFAARTGATVIGARNFLVAYNINLNTPSVRLAQQLARDLRETGRIRTRNGQKVLDEENRPIRDPGSLKEVRAIGWFIEEYGIAQVSMNLTDLSVTPVHKAFEEACRKAGERGLRVTGSELVGMIPLQSLLDAGAYFLNKQHRSAGISQDELVFTAIRSLGLDDITPFDPAKKIIEYAMDGSSKASLAGLSLKDLLDRTASENPVPGGGSVAACLGAFGAALGTMVANLSASRAAWPGPGTVLADWAKTGQGLISGLLSLVDEDSLAFRDLMLAYSLPRASDGQKEERDRQVLQALIRAIEVPMQTMNLALDGFPLIEAMIALGNPNCLSDAGVGLVCLRGAVYGAYLNIGINARQLNPPQLQKEYLSRADNLLTRALDQERLLMKQVLDKLGMEAPLAD